MHPSLTFAQCSRRTGQLGVAVCMHSDNVCELSILSIVYNEKIHVVLHSMVRDIGEKELVEDTKQGRAYMYGAMMGRILHILLSQSTQLYGHNV